jgi:hypothetical protein
MRTRAVDLWTFTKKVLAIQQTMMLGQFVSLFDELLTSEDAKQAEKMMWVVPWHIQDETIKPPPMRITCMC